MSKRQRTPQDGDPQARRKAPVSSTRSCCSFQAMTQNIDYTYQCISKSQLSYKAKLSHAWGGETDPTPLSTQETASTTNQPWELHCKSRHQASRNTYLCYCIEEHAEPGNWTSVPKRQPIRMRVLGSLHVTCSSNGKVRTLLVISNDVTY